MVTSICICYFVEACDATISCPDGKKCVSKYGLATCQCKEPRMMGNNCDVCKYDQPGEETDFPNHDLP